MLLRNHILPRIRIVGVDDDGDHMDDKWRCRNSNRRFGFDAANIDDYDITDDIEPGADDGNAAAAADNLNNSDGDDDYYAGGSNYGNDDDYFANYDDDNNRLELVLVTLTIE